jgi:hypothetical protein
VTVSLVDQLKVVITQGSPAQIALATSLLEKLKDHPENAEAIDDATSLFEAFMHDPHLTRFPRQI